MVGFFLRYFYFRNQKKIMKRNLLFLKPFSFGIFFLPLAPCLLSSCSKDLPIKEADKTEYIETDKLKINQVQTIGSHNSYRIHTRQEIFDFCVTLYNQGVIPPGYNPNEWDYTHIPLEQQFENYRIRSIELDIFHDPQGGQFYVQKGNSLAGLPDTSGIPELLSPGFKILHIPDVDYMTHYYTFKDALIHIENWSDAHPNHFPVFIMIELKTETLKDALPASEFTSSLPFTKNALDSIDLEIKQIFGDGLAKVITPDKIRGNYATINDAIHDGGWPTIGETRGKVGFILMTSSQQTLDYLSGHDNLRNRAAFIFSSPGSPEGAFLKYDDAVANLDTIKKYVAQGYFIRTRADAGTMEARTGDYGPMTKAFESGAQLISTDYYKPDYRCDTSSTWTCYSVQFADGNTAVVNPVTGPVNVKSRLLFE